MRSDELKFDCDAMKRLHISESLLFDIIHNMAKFAKLCYVKTVATDIEMSDF